MRRHPLAWFLPLSLALLTLAGVAAGGGTGDTPSTPEVEPEALEQARAAGRALGTELMGALLKELKEGGPARAVRVCSEVAQDTAATHSTDTTTVRRVSLKVRNPADRPDDYERAQLERLAELHRQGELPEEVAEVRQEDGRQVLRWLKPIVLNEMCLQCHGDPEGFQPEVRELLEQRYPEDEAVGYQAGDLRGAISVRVELASAHAEGGR